MPDEKYFNSVYLDIDKSLAYKKYCYLMSNLNFKQFNRLNLTQLTKACVKLAPTSTDVVLDLGCGLGYLSEYWANEFHSKIIGVDLSEVAINAAKKRCSKNSNLEFFCGNFEQIEFPEKTVDLLLCVDALGRNTNYEKLFGIITKTGKPTLRGGIFHSEIIIENEPLSLLEPEATDVARFLRKNKLQFDYIDFTEEEKIAWTKSETALIDLKSDFINEGSIELYQDCLDDTKSFLKILKENRMKRYFYYFKTSI
jgi:2-polyprenyl-3-methyl-5-hydroxy-6-metoxy-1,4-benzoquinol methylase